MIYANIEITSLSCSPYEDELYDPPPPFQWAPPPPKSFLTKARRCPLSESLPSHTSAHAQHAQAHTRVTRSDRDK